MIPIIVFLAAQVQDQARAMNAPRTWLDMLTVTVCRAALQGFTNYYLDATLVKARV